MTEILALIKRNNKLFFKDKGMFFTSMITPLILLLLYMTFLANLYRDSFKMAIPQGFSVPDELIDGIVGDQLIASLLAVCCITVAFSANMLMVQDKITGARKDMTITPVKSSSMALGYYISSAFVTLVICYVAVAVGCVYLGIVGWYLSFADILLILFDVFLLVMFGTALSSIVNFFLNSQGQLSAVGTIVSAGYGFICGAYMPISEFGDGLQKAVSFLPGTYGTSLIKNHFMRGALAEMKDLGVPNEVIDGVRDSIDCNIYFFGDKVSISSMYIILGSSVAVLMAVYIIMNIIASKKAK